MIKLQKYAPLLLWVCLILIASSSTKAQNQASGEFNDTINIHSWLPTSLDPQFATLIGDYVTLPNFYEGLFEFDSNGKIIPAQAKSWEVSEDGLTYTFTLHDDLTWSDGHPLTAHDFVTQFRRLASPQPHKFSKASYLLSSIKNAIEVTKGDKPVEEIGIRALDDKTLIVEVSAPTPHLPSILVNPALVPVPTHLIEKFGENWSKPENIAVNGAFAPSPETTDTELVIYKNSRYRNADEVDLEHIVITQSAQDEASIASLLKGEIDILHDYPGHRTEWLKQHDAVNVLKVVSVATSYVSVNKNSKKISDIRIPTAMSIALPRKLLLTRTPSEADSLPAYSFTPIMSNFDWTPPIPEWTKKSLEERQQMAQALMKDAGFGPDNRLKLIFAVDDRKRKKTISRAAQSYWHAIYLDFEMVYRPVKDHYTYLAKSNTHSHDIALAGWGADFADPISFLGVMESDAPKNYARWKNKQYDDLLMQLRTSQEVKVRTDLVAKMEALIAQELPIIPLSHHVRYIAMTNKLEFQGKVNSFLYMSFKHIKRKR